MKHTYSPIPDTRTKPICTNLIKPVVKLHRSLQGLKIQNAKLTSLFFNLPHRYLTCYLIFHCYLLRPLGN